jgi:hypothetical protein
MNQSPTIGALAAALAKAQAAFKPALKDASNPFFKSRYCDLSGAIDAVRDALSTNGLALVQSTDAGDKLVLHTTLLHSSGEWISGTYPITAVKTDPQGIGSPVTYARRYSLMALLGIAAEDDDGEAAHGRTAKVDITTGEVKKAQPKWSDEQRTEIGRWNSAIIQGVENGEALVNKLRQDYKYAEPPKVIEAAKALAKEHGVEP